MGKEMHCDCRWDKRVSAGKALPETSELLFRGEFRLAIPFKEMKSVKSVEGELRIESPQGKISLMLGPAAAKWADKILHPPTRIDKLGVKPGAAVALVGVEDAEFEAELTAAKADLLAGKPSAPCDIVFFGVGSREDLKNLKPLRKAIKPEGAIWIIYPKGVKIITQADVFAAGHDAGLVDVKVAGFSERATALKFVIPVAKR